MGAPMPPAPVKLVCGIIACGPAEADAAAEALARRVGAIDARSEAMPFTATDYYAAEMGPSLLRRFVAFRDLVDPARLAALKRLTGTIEDELRREDGCRRVNLDPGYVTPAKLVLATTKDYAHRIYLADGIYAEVTLAFTRAGRRDHEWTYPDFRSGAYDAFLFAVRRRLLEQLRQPPGDTARRAAP